MPQPAFTHLPDEDVQAAMRSMTGYLDITPEDFREIYAIAHEQAVRRLFARRDVPHLMRRDLSALKPEQNLCQAAEQMALMHAHTLPVVDESGRVLGDVSEWNVLRGFGADTFFSLVFRVMNRHEHFADYCQRTSVAEVMTAPSTVLAEHGSFSDIARAFHQVDCQRLPVVDAEGRLVGVVLRRDFMERLDWDVLV
ncbi:HPP family protein [Halothiobacillus sp. DCM-1]|uniref:CBS domain-containing protein n=1 Tax=Halothiobacillus sp. DCM-1 TaxID=3112558 RepID=UPI0032438574